MATIKSYTDLEQSKKLAEILPIESADMYWWSTSLRYYIEAIDDGDFNEEEGHIRAWSLAALLDVLHNPSLHKTFSGWRCDSNNKEGTTCKFGEPYDNPIDACVAMIEKLHELKML